MKLILITIAALVLVGCGKSPDELLLKAVLDGDINKTIMIGDSETDANAAKAAEVPIILLENGYTEKNTTEIYHNHLIKDFIGIEKIITKYL